MQTGTRALSPMSSLAGTRRGSKLALYAEAEAAERLLVLADFKRAGEAGLSLLKSTFYAADSEDVRTRGAFVYVQAMFETGRFREVYPTLMEEYGSLEKLDCDTLLLWVALALDEGLAHEAGDVLLEFLDSCLIVKSRGSFERIRHDGPTLTEAQYEAAIRMYTTEVLGRELGLWTEAMEWVVGCAHNLPDHSRDALLQELAALEAGPELEPVRIAPLSMTGRAVDDQSCDVSETAQRNLPSRFDDSDSWRPPPLPRKEEEAPRSPLSPQEMEFAGDGTPRSLETAGPGAWIAATSARLLEICGQVFSFMLLRFNSK
eukprot:jgi/Botrbrau1/22696/Bobra.0132s0037.2